MSLSEYRRGIVLFFLFMLILLWGGSSEAQDAANSPGNVFHSSDKKNFFPVFELPIPQNEAQKNYLELSGSGNFKLTQIKSPVIIIEFFNTQCPHCKNTAPKINELYEAIQIRSDMKEKIKIIGIGVNCASREVELFRARYKVLFPLFSDPADTISPNLGVKKLPAFIGLKNNYDGTMEMFYCKTGRFWLWNENRFLKKIIKLSKLKPTK